MKFHGQSNKVRRFSTALMLAFLLVLTACHIDQKQAANIIPNQLPIAVSNNAVAYLNLNGSSQYYSFNGLLAGKTYQDITNRAFVWRAGQWREMSVPASQKPVLASVAVAVNDDVYLFGGYTVAADHTEKSIPNVWRIDGHTDQWAALPAMPTPVDDAVALVYQERYIYLISGWHDVDNVDLVQVFDTEDQTWHSATAFPLPPVFGHAGGIIGNTVVICDGVKVTKKEDKKQFLPSPACATGIINPEKFTEIDWQETPHHSGTAYYRMAASNYNSSQIYFMAGSDNPYNYDGIGYNGIPSQPSSDVRVFDLSSKQWIIQKNAIPATMDHRAALNTSSGLVILGGMKEQQKVTDTVTLYNKNKKTKRVNNENF